MADEKVAAVAAGPEVEKPRQATSEAGQYPDPRSLEAVMRHRRDHGQKHLLRFLSTISREDFIRPLECLTGGSIRDRLVHMVDAEGFWMSVLQQRVHDPLSPAGFSDLDSIIPIMQEASDRTLNVLHTVDADWFVRQSLFAHPHRKEPLRLVPSLVVLHILTHEYHHKGQICLAARALGYTPPDLDFI